MSEKNIKRVHLIYGIVLSALLVTVAVLFAVMCVDIFNETGEIGVFTPERISLRFAKISVWVYTTVALIIIGGIFNTIYPLESKSLKGTVCNSIVLKRLYCKLKGLSPEAGDKIERERILRFAMIIASMVFIIFASLGSFIYICNNFDANATINSEVAGGWLDVLYFFVGPFLYLILTAYVCKRSIKRELGIVKGEFKNSSVDTEDNKGTFTKITDDIHQTVQKAKEPKKWHKTFSLVAKIALACLIVVFIIVGIVNGGMDDVIAKANKICSECIGLG